MERELSKLEHSLTTSLFLFSKRENSDEPRGNNTLTEASGLSGFSLNLQSFSLFLLSN